MSKFSDVTTGILTVCAVAVTAAVIKREVLPSSGAAEVRTPREIKEWASMVDAGHLLGTKQATVCILEFSDFQCPFCRTVQVALGQVRAKYPDQVAIIYRHFPLEALHPFAFKAAVASECAAEQDQFGSFHSVLFADQGGIGNRSWEDYAAEAGVPLIADFTRCLDAEEMVHRVQRDFDAARSIDLGGTPSIIVNGTLLPGTPTLTELLQAVEDALAATAKSSNR